MINLILKKLPRFNNDKIMSIFQDTEIICISYRQLEVLLGCHDTQHNDTLHNAIQHEGFIYDKQHNRHLA